MSIAHTPTLRALLLPRWSRLHLPRFNHRQCFSVKPDDLSPKSSENLRSRILRLSSKLPKFFRRYTTPLIDAPLTHISAFLLLHEATAVLPLFGLAATFHYTDWLPSYVSEGKWVKDSMNKFGNYFKKKGWLGEEGQSKRHLWWGRGEQGMRIVTEFATAYVITKALLPVRLMISISATPWFAKTAIVPLTNVMRRVRKTH